MTWLLIFLALVFAVLSVPTIRESRRAPPDTSRAPGRFAELSNGQTHYMWHGGVRGPVIVCIHGLTTPSPVWEGVIPGLLDLGFRVLVYDLYGRGYSDAPSGQQDEAFFVSQLEELLRDQNVEEDVTLFGYSMGGSIATAFAAKNPHQVLRLVLVAPAGIDMIEEPFHAYARRFRLIGDWLHGMAEPIRMRREIEADGDGAWPEIDAARRAALDRSGYFPAILSSRRGILDDRQEEAHREIGRAGIPVLAVFGEKDAVIPLGSMGKLAQWNRTARQEMIDGAGHDLVYAHGDLISGMFRDFLRSV